MAKENIFVQQYFKILYIYYSLLKRVLYIFKYFFVVIPPYSGITIINNIFCVYSLPTAALSNMYTTN